MIKNNVDISITDEQAATVAAGLEDVQSSMDFLVSITGEESRALFKLGPKSEAFVITAVDAAVEHTALLPAGILENMQRDVAVREKLRPILAKLQQLGALVEGTYGLAGADLMKNATAVYHILRLNGQQEGLEPLMAQLGARFQRRPRTEPEPEPEPTVTSTTTTAGA